MAHPVLITDGINSVNSYKYEDWALFTVSTVCPAEWDGVRREAPSLVGRVVFIDKASFIVKGVDRFMMASPYKEGEPIALLLKRFV